MAGRLKRVYRRERALLVDMFRPLRVASDAVAKRVALFAQGRSGTTALGSLLNCHPQMYFDREILSRMQFRRFLFPYYRVQARSRIAADHGKPAYGFHVKINQLTRHQRISDPRAFLERLLKDSWKLVYLYRGNYVRQAISNVVARTRGLHTARNNETLGSVEISVEEVVERVRLKQDFLRQESKALADLPHLALRYESDLLDSNRHQETANRVFSWLGLDHHDVEVGTRRTSTDKLGDTVSNFAELQQALETEGVGEMLAQP